jgi:hypothetical protein
MVGEYHEHAVRAEIVEIAPDHLPDQKTLRGIREDDFDRACAIVEQERYRTAHSDRELVQMPMGMLAAVHVGFRRKQIVDAANVERDVLLPLERYERAATVAMLLQLDAFDIH